MSRHACSIPEYESDTVVLTGGEYDSDALSTVERYDLNGLVETLPSLNQAREGHGCGYFYNKDGTKVKLTVCVSLYLQLQDQVLLVAGGEVTSSTPLRSTETYIPGSDHWTTVHPLPVPVANAAHVSLYNNIYLLGDVSSAGALIISPLISQETTHGAWGDRPTILSTCGRGKRRGGS